MLRCCDGLSKIFVGGECGILQKSSVHDSYLTRTVDSLNTNRRNQDAMSILE